MKLSCVSDLSYMSPLEEGISPKIIHPMADIACPANVIMT